MDTYLGDLMLIFITGGCGRFNLNKYTNKELNKKKFSQKGTQRGSENVTKIYTNLSKIL